MRKEKLISLFDVVFAAVLSFFSVLIYNVYQYHEFKIAGFNNTIHFILKTSLFFVCFIAVAFFLHVFERNYKNREYKIKVFEPSPLGIIKGTLLISLCYLPVVIIFYPGVCSWDTINQLNDYITDTKPLPFDWIQGQEKISVFLNDHHPVFDTLVFVFFYNIGETLGDHNIGIFLYSLISMVATASAFSYMICFINKMKLTLPKIPLLIFVLFHPVLVVYSFSMIKDSLFSIFFVWYFVIFISLLLDKASRQKFVAFIVISLLLALTKKTGIYILIPTNIALIFAKITTNYAWRKYAVISIAAPALLIFIIFPKIVFPAANIFPGGRQELLGPLLQQSARVELDNPKYYNVEEKKALSNIIDYENIKENYEYKVSDGIKDTYNLRATSKDIISYLKVWVKTGFHNPVSYMKATIGNSGGFFAPVIPMQLHRDITVQPLLPDIKNFDKFNILREKYLQIYDFLLKIPVISFLFTNVLFSLWIPLFYIVRCFKKKGKNNFIMSIPIIFSVIILIVSPNSHIRYALPLVYCAPLIVGVGLNRGRNEKIVTTKKYSINSGG